MQKGDEYPLDEYGKSMFAVCVDPEGMITYITCRWNHGAFGRNDISNADNVIKPKDLSKIVNMNVYEVCKPYSKQELRVMGYIPFDEVQELLNMGEKPEDVFEYVDDFEEGFARVKLNGKWNFIDTERNILSKTWFDYAFPFKEGFALVKLNGKENFIDTNGSILSDTWFDRVESFKEGFGYVYLNGKENFIDTNGSILSDTWFDRVGIFIEGFASVKLNDKYNFIDTKGSILSKTWFDRVEFFKEGFGYVYLNGKWNYYIDKDGHLYDMNKQPITESFTGLQKRIYESIQIGIRKGLRRI